MTTASMTTRRTRMLMFLLVGVGLLLVIGANAHLLFAALNSQPDCIAHLKAGHAVPGAFGAADSAC
ncbi:MAG: hypothetical protein ABI216_03545 [Devosia sp.]